MKLENSPSSWHETARPNAYVHNAYCIHAIHNLSNFRQFVFPCDTAYFTTVEVDKVGLNGRGHLVLYSSSSSILLREKGDGLKGRSVEKYLEFD